MKKSIRYSILFITMSKALVLDIRASIVHIFCKYWDDFGFDSICDVRTFVNVMFIKIDIMNEDFWNVIHYMEKTPTFSKNFNEKAILEGYEELSYDNIIRFINDGYYASNDDNKVFYLTK
jgi:hypothetical protein